MHPARANQNTGRLRFIASVPLLLLVLWVSVLPTQAQTGIFSIFRTPQQSDVAPQADAEEDAELAAPPLNALPAPDLPLPPRRMTTVANPAAPAPPPPPLVAVPPPPVAPPPPSLVAVPPPPLAPPPPTGLFGFLVPPPPPPPPPLPAAPAPGEQLAAAPDLPIPPRRPGAPEPATEPPAEAVAPAAPAIPMVDPESFSENPRMMASLPFPGFRPMQQPPLQQQETTTEELEKEEERTPEPMQVEKQTDYVDIACLKPELMSLVRKAGDKFGATPVITSGQRYRGRLGSYHRRCMAADFFVPGVARSDLARYLRSLPEAGGVGTYCHTKSVHIDIGEPRNWSQCGFRFRFSQRG